MPAIPERRVLELWQSTIQRRTDLITTENGPVTIIYPGRPNDGRGADLKDAVIATGQGVFTGDIEIHVKSSAWKEHGHHRDPAYNSVILHVVQEQDNAGQPARRQNGLAVPTLALAPFSEEQTGNRLTTAFTPVLTLPCTAAPDVIAGVLEAAGKTRFFQKSREFEDDLLQESPGQVLYRGMMTALGYSRNKTPMEKLARSLPLPELETITYGAAPDERCQAQLAARLLGMAGLLPGQRPGQEPSASPYERELEQIWLNSGIRAQMSRHEWEFYKVRPGNYPTRRIAAMSVLLTRFRKQGMLETISAITGGSAGNGNALMDILQVQAEGFRGSFIDFGLPVKGPAPALIGEERAREIIINVLLPFYAAWGRFTGRQNLAEAAVEIYRRFPAGTENSLEKHMRRQLELPLKLVNTALKRQGLIHIYKTFCTQGKCQACALNRGAI